MIQAHRNFVGGSSTSSRPRGWQSVRRPVKAALGCLGVPDLYARLSRRRGAIILMYHSVAGPDEAAWIDPANHVPADVFEEQMRFLAERRKVLPLLSIVDMLNRGASPPAGSVAITFDDGYLDNLLVAAPILDSLGLCATLFLATGYVERADPQWIDVAYACFAHRKNARLEWAEAPAGTWLLDSVDVERQAYGAVCDSLLKAEPTTRRTLLNDLHTQLAPSQEPPRLTLDWSDVRRLVQEYRCFELGAHTVDHIDLTGTEDLAEHQVQEACAAIARQSGRQARLFSFPYGRSSPRLRDVLKRSGLAGACGGGHETVIDCGCDPFAMSRVPAPRSMHQFEFLTSTANTGILRRCMR
ncbi:MAG: polysaccharide deacetylase family protein [Phycisphaerales bacterium]|nr:polysaccharide deacetylase family protein [Phycisphaerales bacterium]